MSHSGMVQSAGSSGGPANNQGGRNSQAQSKYTPLPQGHQAQHVQPPPNHSVPPQHRANPQPPAPPLRPPTPAYQYSRPLAPPDMKSGPAHVANQGSLPHQAMGAYGLLPSVSPMQMQHASAPLMAQPRGFVMMRGQPGAYNPGRLPSQQVQMGPNSGFPAVRQNIYMASNPTYPSPNFYISPNAQMGQNMTPSPIISQSQPTQNSKRPSKAIPIVNPETGEQVTAGQRKSSSGPPAPAPLMVLPSTMGAMPMPVTGAPIAGPPPTNPVFVPGSPGMPLPMPVMDQEQQPKAPVVPTPESVVVDVQTKRENSSSSHSPAPQIGANVAPPAAPLAAPTPVVPPAPEAPVEPVKDVPPPVVSAPVQSAKLDSNSTKPVPSVADEDEERRKVEERNEENLRKSQEATKHDSSQSAPVQENSTAPVATVAEVPDAAAPAAPAQDEPKQVVESTKAPAEEQQKEVTEPPTASAPQSPPASSVPAAGDVKGVEPAPAPSSPKAASDTTLEEGEVVSDEGETDPVLSATGHMYKPGQWSPVCPDGKKQYDRDFLLKLQNRPLSMNPPSEMPILDIFKEHRHTLPSVSGISYASASLDGYTQRNGQRPGVGAMHRNKPNQMRNASDRTKKIITLSSSMNEDVKLHVAENAWKPVKEQNADSDAALYKKFRGILNKLTPQKFAALLDQVKQLEINTEERLSNVTNLVLEKALNETHFASTYAKLCHTLLTEFQIVKKDNEMSTAQTVNFRKMLLQKCQQEFERDTDDSAESRKREKEQEETRSKQLKECETEQQRKELLESFEEQDLKAKRRTLGLMRFIGELYNLSILNFNIMHDCFLKLLKNPTDEDSIVCACKLFTTVGKKLNEDIKNCQKEHDKAVMKDKYEQLMLKLKKIIIENREAQKNNGVHLPTRVIFMLEDVWELKNRAWIPRRDEQAPKTLDQIQKEAENEKILASHLPGSSGGGGGGSNARYNSMPNDRNRGRNYNNQSQTGGTNYKATKDLLGQIKLPLNSTPFGATRGGQNWVAGASGGGSRNSSLRGSSRLDNNDSSPSMNSVNRYELLTTDASDHPVRSQESSPSRAHDREQVRGREAAIQGARTLSHHGNNRAQSGPRSSAPTSRTPSLSGPTAPGTTYSLLGKNEDNQDQVKRYAETIFAEFLVNANKDDFLHDFCERVHKDNLEQFIAHFINLAVEKPKNLGPLAEAIRELHNARILSVRNFESILKEQLEYAEDMVIDIPKYYEYMADLVSQLVNEMDSISLIRVICDTLKNNAPKLLLPLFKRIKEAGGNGIAAKWKKSGLSIAELVSGASDSEMKLLEEALTDLGAPSSASAVPEMSVAELTKRFRAAFDIEDVAKRDKELEDIIQKAGKDGRVTALRACATAILQFGLKERTRFDQTYVNQHLSPIPAPIKELFTEDICIHALYALQLVSHDLHHPREIASPFLNFVYDHDLVDENTILKWGDNTSTKHEHVGYQMTTAHAQSFLAWLNTTPSSGPEAEPNN